MDGKQALGALRNAKPVRVPIDEIIADEALQPRILDAVRYGQRALVRKLSEQQTVNLMRKLEGDTRRDLDPILLARTDSGLLVVDGFHRLRAYELAGRITIPARVFEMNRETAAMAAQLANLDLRALDVHPDQRREALWQRIAEMTGGTGQGLPVSQRALVAETGVARNTIASMLKHMPHAARRAWPEEDRHPVTGFVRWHVVKRDLVERFTDEEGNDEEDDAMNSRDRKAMEQVAEKLIALITLTEPHVLKGGFARAIHHLQNVTYDEDDKAAIAMLRQTQRAHADCKVAEDGDCEF